MKNAILAAERVYLRAVEQGDVDAFAAGLTDEPETFFDRGRFPVSPIAVEHWFEEVAKRDPPTDIVFAVCLVATDELIGSVGMDHLDLINRTAETGSYLFPAWRNQGYGPEAKHLLLEYAFDRLHLHAVCSHVWEPNARSAAALVKQGYRPAGRWKWDDLKDGVYRDTLIFDLLRPEWLAARDAWQVERRSSGEG